MTLVPKKGRPVTQCQHCRLERKKRSAHNKCDCADDQKPHHSKEKCIHLREAEERAKAGGSHDDILTQLHDDEESSYLASVAEEQGCCCRHGGQCTCGLVRKEQQSKGSTPPHGPAVPKPRLDTIKSDGSITVFANGHHKPVHKRNHAAHECGMPYKLPMPRSQTEMTVSQAARRSVDSLQLNTSNPSFNASTFLPQNTTPLFNKERRLSKSEQPSPNFKVTGTCDRGLSDVDLSAIDFSDIGPPLPTTQGENPGSTMFPAFEPMSDMIEASFDPWSAYPSAESMPNNNPFGAWPTTVDHSGITQPALTAASSGTQSEIDEIPAMEDLYGFSMPSIQEDIGTFDFESPPNDPSAGNRRSLPPGFFGNADFTLPPHVNNVWQTPVESIQDSDEGKFPEAWSTPTMSTMTSIPDRQSATTPNMGRPQSHSIGPGSVPNDDLIRQLFPDMFDSADGNTSTVDPGSEAKRMDMSGLSVSTSNPMDDGMDFTSQSWSDGSMTVPNDDFASQYDLEQDYKTTSQNTSSWPFQ